MRVILKENRLARGRKTGDAHPTFRAGMSGIVEEVQQIADRDNPQSFTEFWKVTFDRPGDWVTSGRNEVSGLTKLWPAAWFERTDVVQEENNQQGSGKRRRKTRKKRGGGKRKKKTRKKRGSAPKFMCGADKDFVVESDFNILESILENLKKKTDGTALEAIVVKLPLIRRGERGSSDRSKCYGCKELIDELVKNTMPPTRILPIGNKDVEWLQQFTGVHKGRACTIMGGRRKKKTRKKRGGEKSKKIKKLTKIFQQYPKIFPSGYFRFLAARLENHINKNTLWYRNGVVLTWIKYQKTVKKNDKCIIKPGDVKLDQIVNKNQGNGAAKKVVMQFLKKFEKNRIWLEVRANNKRAIKFYRKNGFKKVCNIKFGEIPGIMMVKN